MRAVAVVPTYNERENLPLTVELILKHAPGVDVLVVDDNSPDGTGAVADHLAEQSPGAVLTLHRGAKAGLGAAYRDAFRHVLELGYEAIVQLDADLSHDPAVIPAFLERLQEADLVLGTRYLGGVRVLDWDFKRLLLSKSATQVARIATGLRYSDLTGGYKAWRRAALEAIDLDAIPARGYLFQIETTVQAHLRGLRIVELPIVFQERRRGMSKIDSGVILEATAGVIRLGFAARFGSRRR